MIDRNIITTAVAQRAQGVRCKTIAVKFWIPEGTLRHWLKRLSDCDGDIEAALVPRKRGRPRKS